MNEIIFFLILVITFSHSAEIFEVGEMPFLITPKPSFKQFTGYITIPSTQRHLFYWFIECETNPSTAPVVTWFSGGPGCSSLDGLFNGNGPWRSNINGEISQIGTSWNKFANMLFIDSPVFVGFSYSDDENDIKNSDERTANDAHEFLKIWFEKFPSYKTNNFWLSGQSYAGHYVPNLAKKIIQNKATTGFNFKGFVVGNPLLDFRINIEAALTMYEVYTLVSPTVIEDCRTTCNMSIGPDWFMQAMQDQQKKCVVKIMGIMGSIAENVDNYAVFNDKCLDSGKNKDSVVCNKKISKIYLERPEVQKALGLRATNLEWNDCNNNVFGNYSEQDSYGSVASVLGELWEYNNKSEYKFLIYSGDQDSNTHPTTSLKVFKDYGFQLKTDMKNWFLNDQVGGRQYLYEGFTFTTIRGSGHIAPLTAPERTFCAVKNFILNGEIPETNIIDFPKPITSSSFKFGFYSFISIGFLIISFLF